MRVFMFFIAAVFSLAAGARPVAGPMLGPVSRHTATIWVQGQEAARVAVEIEPAGGRAARRSPTVTLAAETGYTATIPLTDLAAGTAHRYRLVWNGKPLDPAYSFTTLPAKGAGDFTAYLGSCAHLHDPETDGTPAWSGGYDIFDRIATQAAADTHPKLMLWLGDNVYLRTGDVEHPSGMARRYQKVRRHPALQTLLSALPHYAIWDDHDYGPNDHNQSFVFKAASLDLFRRYWPNPSAGLPDMPGIYTQFSVADADFFLLDDRWYRDSDRDKSDNKTLYGPDQLRWLKNALMASRARFKFIAGGSQFLNDLSRHEGWHHFREERRDFLAWLELNNISGVLFLSGDRHRTELLRQERPGNYPLHELTCSPLTSGVHPIDSAEADHPSRVAGTLVAARNFCTLRAQGEGASRALLIQSLDAQGKPLWEVRLEAASLRKSRSPSSTD
jgi:alkaline phosphatase D